MPHMANTQTNDFSKGSVAGNILRLALPSQILRMCRKHGIDKILFATDSPWSGQKEDMEYIRKIGFTEEELEKILYKNGARLLGLPCQG